MVASAARRADQLAERERGRAAVRAPVDIFTPPLVGWQKVALPQ